MCGLESGRVANPWMIDHERKVSEVGEEIEILIGERIDKHKRSNCKEEIKKAERWR